jgi:TatA/E family protein of Tat protein translocase
MFGIGIQELAIIFVVALLIFGPKRLPEFARSLGKGLAEFRRASSDLRQSFSLDMDPPDSPPRDASTRKSPEADPRTREEEPERPPQAVDGGVPAPDAPDSASEDEPEAPGVKTPDRAPGA